MTMSEQLQTTGATVEQPLLAGKRLLITGVVTRHSIAWAVAEHAQRAGAEVVLTSFGRALSLTRRAARQLPVAADVLELDVTSEADLARVAEQLDERWGALDGALHAIAFAPPDALGGRFLETSAASARTAFEVSAFSYKSLAHALTPLLDRAGGGSLVGMSFDPSRAWPVYDWMGVSKAALEAVCRYLSRDLGPRRIRANIVSAGPLKTVAAESIPGFEQLAGAWTTCAPLGWDTADAGPVARAACFLLSDWATAITGEVLHVDGGFHAVAALP